MKLRLSPASLKRGAHLDGCQARDVVAQLLQQQLQGGGQLGGTQESGTIASRRAMALMALSFTS